MQFVEIELSLNKDDDLPRQLFTEADLLATDIFIYNGDIHPSLHRVFRKHTGASGRQKVSPAAYYTRRRR